MFCILQLFTAVMNNLVLVNFYIFTILLFIACILHVLLLDTFNFAIQSYFEHDHLAYSVQCIGGENSSILL